MLHLRQQATPARMPAIVPSIPNLRFGRLAGRGPQLSNGTTSSVFPLVPIVKTVDARCSTSRRARVPVDGCWSRQPRQERSRLLWDGPDLAWLGRRISRTEGRLFSPSEAIVS